MQNWIIYKHTNKINGKVYIGQTCQDLNKRWNCGKGYSEQAFGKAITKYGWDNFTHEILESNLSFEQANEKEIYYIELYNATNSKKGYNKMVGGQQSLGDFSKKKIYQMDLKFNIIKEFESIISAAKELNIPEGRIYRSCYRKGQRNNHCKSIFRFCFIEDYNKIEKEKEEFDAVCQLDKNLNIIQEFKTCLDVKNKLGFNPRGAVYGNNITCHGYYWCLKSKLKEFKPRAQKKWHSSGSKKRIIEQIDIKTNKILNTYSTIIEAAKAVGLSSGKCIRMQIQGLTKSAAGFKWNIKE